MNRSRVRWAAVALVTLGCQRAREVPHDATARTDTRFDAGRVFDDAGIPHDARARVRPPRGAVRFVNLAAGTGEVRFVATSVPGRERSYVEVVLDEGGSSGYLPALAEAHLVHVTSAVADAGGDLAPPLALEVPRGAGCTVVFAGRGASGPGVHALTRLRDDAIPLADAGVSLRFVSALRGPPVFDVRERDTVLAHALSWLAASPRIALDAGPHTFALTASDGGAPVSEPLDTTAPTRGPHTLFLWGELAPPRRHRHPLPTVRTLLTADAPPPR